MKFIKELFSTQDSVSSKRVIAFVAFIFVIIIAVLKYDTNTIIAFLSFIASLLGLSTIDKFSNNNPPTS